MKTIVPIIVLSLILACNQSFAQVNPPITKGKQKNGVENYYNETGWRIGIAFGNTMIHGDIKPRLGLGISLLGEKMFSEILSVKGDFTYGMPKGLNWYMNGAIRLNSAWNGDNSNADYVTGEYGGMVFYNFRTSFVNLNFTGEFNLKEYLGRWVDFPAADKWGFELLLGGGAMLYRTQVNALDSDGNPYDFLSISDNEIISSSDKSERSVLKGGLRSMYDKSYETDAEVNSSKPNLFNMTLTPVIIGGIGFKYILSDQINLGLEASLHRTFDDFIDGHQWTEYYESSRHDDWVSFIRITGMYNLSKKLNNQTKKSKTSYIPKSKIKASKVNTDKSHTEKTSSSKVAYREKPMSISELKKEHPNTITYYIVLGSFTKIGTAQELHEKYVEEMDTKLIKQKTGKYNVYRVLYGGFDDNNVATKELTRIRNDVAGDAWLLVID